MSGEAAFQPSLFDGWDADGPGEGEPPVLVAGERMSTEGSVSLSDSAPTPPGADAREVTPEGVGGWAATGSALPAGSDLDSGLVVRLAVRAREIAAGIAAQGFTVEQVMVVRDLLGPVPGRNRAVRGAAG